MEPLADPVERAAAQLYPERSVRRRGSMVDVVGVGIIAARVEDVRGRRTGRVIASAVGEPGELRYPFDPASEGELAVAVANALAYLENPREHTRRYPND